MTRRRDGSDDGRGVVSFCRTKVAPRVTPNTPDQSRESGVRLHQSPVLKPMRPPSPCPQPSYRHDRTLTEVALYESRHSPKRGSDTRCDIQSWVSRATRDKSMAYRGRCRGPEGRENVRRQLPSSSRIRCHAGLGVPAHPINHRRLSRWGAVSPAVRRRHRVTASSHWVAGQAQRRTVQGTLAARCRGEDAPEEDADGRQAEAGPPGASMRPGRSRTRMVWAGC